MEILVIQHQEAGHVAAFGAALAEGGARLDERDASRGDPLPGDGGGYDGLVVLGGVMNAYQEDEYPHLAEAAALIREFHGRGRPVLGICLGAQLIAHALGGRVYPHSVAERGFVPLTLTDGARGDALLAGVASPQWLFQWHDHTFDPPPGARLLATGAACRQQIVRVGETTHGFQCHFEVTRDVVEGWVAGSRKSHDDPAHTEFHARVDAELDRHIDASLAFCRGLAARWTALVARRRAA